MGKQLLLVVTVLVAAAVMALPPPHPAFADPPTPVFDWSMPARTGLDVNGDGVPDSLTTKSQIDPGTFRIDFDACASTGSIQSYVWRINGEIVEIRNSCTFSTQLAESVYTVSLQTIAPDGSNAAIEKLVVVQDWLIVAVGDSYGSGEGNPEKLATFDILKEPFPQPAVWQNEACRRSHISGQAKAAQKIEDDDPRTSVTLVHLSCTGATIPSVVEQLSTAGTLIGDREIDALLVSVGGNDVGFSTIVIGCIVSEPCNRTDPLPEYIGVDALRTLCGLFLFTELVDACNQWVDGIPEPDESAATLFQNKLASVPTADLHNKIDSFPVLDLIPSRVYWAEYPNATEDDDGSICAVESDGVLNMLPGITAGESLWVRDTMTRQLNQKIKDTAESFGWTYVDGVFDAFHNHGYCADNYWLVRIGESFLWQLNQFGTLHPNEQGHNVYRDKIWLNLKADLYLFDDLNNPRSPLDLVDPIVTGTPDREPNQEGWYNADVTIHWSTTDPVPSSGLLFFPGDSTASMEGFNVLYKSGLSCDLAGNCGRGEISLSIDKTPPVITSAPGEDSCTAHGNSGWCRGAQTAGFAASDATSGTASPCSTGPGFSCPFTQTSAEEGVSVTIASGPACDNAGNCNPGIERQFMIDPTAPTVTRNKPADSCSLPGDNGWCRGSQTAGFGASDATSGVATPCGADAGSSCDFEQSTATDGTDDGSAVTIASGEVCDVAGNCNPGIDAGPFMLDTTPPGLAPTIDPAPIVLNGAATATPNATDATSGIASQSCDPVDTSTAGAHTLECTATDNAGNTRTVGVDYVVEYTIPGGFSQPGAISNWKAGTTVPIKVTLTDGNGDSIPDSEAQALLSPECLVTLSVSGPQTASACMRYDTKEGQFVYNWRLGPETGEATIAVTISYPGSNGTTVLSMQIVITE